VKTSERVRQRCPGRCHELSIGHGRWPTTALTAALRFGDPVVRRCRRSPRVFVRRCASATGSERPHSAHWRPYSRTFPVAYMDKARSPWLRLRSALQIEELSYSRQAWLAVVQRIDDLADGPAVLSGTTTQPGRARRCNCEVAGRVQSQIAPGRRFQSDDFRPPANRASAAEIAPKLRLAEPKHRSRKPVRYADHCDLTHGR